MKVLLGVIAIGDNFLEQYKKLFMNSHENYAKKHGYEFKIFNEIFDNPNKYNRTNITMNKYLMFCQDWSNNYDFIIWIDCDILININSPAIHEFLLNENTIGIIDEYSQPTKEKRLRIQNANIQWGWESCATDYYKRSGFSDLQTDMVFNTGLLVVQPKKHGVFFKYIHEKYINHSLNHPRELHFEQTCIGYEIQKANLYKILDNKFNAIWRLQRDDNIENIKSILHLNFNSEINSEGLIKIENINNISLEKYFKDNYFIHFAGNVEYHRVESIDKLYNH